MDGQRFDRFVRRWATTASRRQALRALVGGALAGPLTRAWWREAVAARCRKRLRRCKRRNQCCGSKAGRTACRQLGLLCQADFPGRRCCGLEGATCDPLNESCDCCPDHSCVPVNATHRCVGPPQ